MPDIQDGLTIGGEPQRTYEEGDVNAPGGFEAALGRAVSGEEPAPAEDPAEPVEDEPEAPEATPEEEAPGESAAQWQARYEELQKLMGRQASELGELRQLVAENGATPPPQQLGGPLDMEALIEENGGQKVIDWAIDNSPERIEEIATLWADSGDPQGLRFYADYRAEQTRLEQIREPQAPAAQDPALQNLALERKLSDTWAHQRAADPQFATYEAGIGPALESRDTPDEIKLMLFSGKPDDMLQAANFLKPYAQLEAIKAGSPPAQGQPEPAPVQDTQAEDNRREAIRRTAIVTGSQRLQEAGAPSEAGELTREQRVALFKERFEEVPSTDISAGLTINGQPLQQQRPARS